MYRIAVFVFWMWTATASEEISFRFTQEPVSSAVKIGGTLRLPCKSNSASEEITWYFNDVRLSTPTHSDTTGNRRQRRKRNKEDRASYTLSRETGFETVLSLPRDWQKNYARFSNPKKIRRRKGERRKNKRRSRKDDDFLTSLKTAKRYVRSADGNDETVDPTELGIEVQPGVLTISSFARKNAGAYHCVAASPSGSIRSTSALIRTAEIHDFFFTPPGTVTTNGGDVAAIPCQMPGSIPEAEARWKVSDETWINETSGDYVILPSGTLVVKNVTSHSDSTFLCAAYNSVTGETKIASSGTLLIVEETEGKHTIVHPKPGSIENITVMNGQPALLECILSNYSLSSWGRTGSDLPSSAEITADGLFFPTVTRSDAGTYSCQSSVSSASVKYQLAVSEIPVVSLKQEDDKILECVSQVPSQTTWTWYYNGVQVDSAKDNVLNVSSGEKWSNGYYQCFATNIEGSDYAIFHVKDLESNKSSPFISSSDEYFTARMDESVESPQITSRERTSRPTSYELTWTMSRNSVNVKLFSIKYYKSPSFNEEGIPLSYDWKVVNVPSELRSVVLDDLLPESTYLLEIITVSSDGTRSDIEISSFDTGKIPNLAPPNHPPVRTPIRLPERDKQTIRNKRIQTVQFNSDTNSSGKPRKNKNGRPRAPSRPTVTAISANSVSLMWNPRGNGGSPILGYRIESRKVNTEEGWKTMVPFITTDFPPYELTGLERGATYRFRVIAVNAAGDSKPSSSSPSYPRRAPVRIEPLHRAPCIVDTTTQGDRDIVITWKYDVVPVTSIGGYIVFFRSSDSDDERDYKEKRVNDPTATSYVIRHLQPEMQYDIKIQAYNNQGRSPFSNVMIIEMPGDGRVVVVTPAVVDPGNNIVSDDNDPARTKSNQRNTMFLITGGVIGGVLLVLLVTVFWYWRQKGAQNARESPEVKGQNGNAGSCLQGNNMNMKKINSNGNHESHTPNSFSQSPHDTRCQCSRHHSNHSSLERGGAGRCQYDMAPYNGVPGNYPNIHSNPLHMFVDHGYPIYPHGMGRGPPPWWVREGEFCHIVPGDARKMSGGEMSPEMCGGYSGRAHPIVRTYVGNAGYYEYPTHRPPDNGYHSNEDGIRTCSESPTGKSDEAPCHRDSEADNEADASGSEARRHSDETEINHRPEVIHRELHENDSGRGDTDDVTEDTPLCEEEVSTNSDIVDENTNFLPKSADGRKETLIT